MAHEREADSRAQTAAGFVMDEGVIECSRIRKAAQAMLAMS
jgi:hypothetical protein